MRNDTDLIYQMVRHVLKTRYGDLPQNVVERTKGAIIDTLGIAIAGSPAPGCPELVGLVKDWGGKPESTILAYGGKVPAPEAALANSTMARALDFADVHEGGDGKGVGGFLSATIIPASFAVAEYSKKSVTGKDFILATTLGSDLSCRLRMAMTPHGWLAETFNPLGTAAAAGKLLGFDEEKMINGMGIAYAQCAGNMQAHTDGALTIRLQQGLAGRAGVFAAILAERGFTGAKNVLQGVYGLYPLYCRDEYDPAMVTDKLGEVFEVVNISGKPYPCCRQAHGAIYGTLEILREHGLKPGEVAEVTVTVGTTAYKRVADGEQKYKPRSVVDAQFSLPYTVATALLKGDVFIADFTEEAIKNQQTLGFARRVKVRLDPELDKLSEIPPNSVEITTRDGKRYSKYVEYVKGHPKNPMSMAEYIDKFRKCVPFSAKPIPEGNVMKVIEMAERLEEVADVTEIVKQLA
ncbi:MAG: MmgE/PrpD family protein [Chloroflexota bacterium]